MLNTSPAPVPPRNNQQRLVLEYGYAALHAACEARITLAGSLSGVFLAISTNDFAEIIADSDQDAFVYSATGCAHSIACGRVSYVLGLHGPCVSYDTACSAALVACHATVRTLQHNECTQGLAAGVNLMLTPGIGLSFALAGMTSPAGRSHTFDSRADGYARVEACNINLCCFYISLRPQQKNKNCK